MNVVKLLQMPVIIVTAPTNVIKRINSLKESLIERET